MSEDQQIEVLMNQNSILRSRIDELIMSRIVMFELLSDLYEIMPKILSNTHIDLIQRAKQLIEHKRGEQ